MPARRPDSEARTVFELKEEGRTDREIEQLTGVPVNTIRAWRNRGLPSALRDHADQRPLCSICGGAEHDLVVRSRYAYSYLLGMYLGDGCLTRNGRSWMLRVTLDIGYPGIIHECCDAIEEIRGEKRPLPRRRSDGTQCVVVSWTWHRWRCYSRSTVPAASIGGEFYWRPGSGRSSMRHLDRSYEVSFTQTAGAVSTACTSTGRTTHTPGTSSRTGPTTSATFTDTCEQLGIEWRQWTRYHVSVARQGSVALLDTFVGPKY